LIVPLSLAAAWRTDAALDGPALRGAVGLMEEGIPAFGPVVEAVVNIGIVPFAAVTLRKVVLKPNGGIVTDAGLKVEKVPKLPGMVGLVLDPGVKEGIVTKDGLLEDPVTDAGITEGVLPEVGPTEGGKPDIGLKEGTVTSVGMPEDPVIDAGTTEDVVPDPELPEDGILPEVGIFIVIELPEIVLPKVGLKGGGITDDGVTLGVLSDPP